MHYNDLWFVPEEEVDLPVEWRPPHYIPLPTEPLDILFDAEGYPVILFEPVPQKRRRRVGWDAERQRLFVRMLARVPSVTRAAKAVGMSPRSAYKLLDHPAAESFGRAWDAALEHGLGRLRQSSLARAIEGGEFVPIYRKGKLARIEYRRNDKLAIALLSGRARNVDYFRRGARTRWRQKQEFAAVDAEAAARAEAEALALEEQARAIEAAAKAKRIGPRIRRL